MLLDVSAPRRRDVLEVAQNFASRIEVQDFGDLLRSVASSSAEEILAHKQKYRTMPYEKFLKTRYWRVIRNYVVFLAHWRCEKCGAAESVDVHHLNYSNRGWDHEHLDDLMSMCRLCHAVQHARQDYDSGTISKENFRNKMLSLTLGMGPRTQEKRELAKNRGWYRNEGSV